MSIVSLRLDKCAVPTEATEDGVFGASGIKAYGRVGRFGRRSAYSSIKFDGVKVYTHKGNLHMVYRCFVCK